MAREHGSASMVAGIAVFLVGALIFLIPSFDTLAAHQRASQEIEWSFGEGPARENPVQQGGALGSGASGGAGSDGGADASAAYAFLFEYNKQVLDGSAGGINDPWGIGSDANVLEGVGFSNGVIGVLHIERLGLEQPLFFGASPDHMARGCAIVSGTSAPLGQPSSNVVIAGHRGAQVCGPMFRDIEDLRIGDALSIESKWGTMTYRAVQFEVISPNDSSALAVQEGRDLVTLFTCHPYGHNYERYLAIFERDLSADEVVSDGFDPIAPFSPVQAVSEALTPCSSIQLSAERWLRVAGFAILAAGALLFCVTRLKSLLAKKKGTDAPKGRRRRGRSR